MNVILKANAKMAIITEKKAHIPLIIPAISPALRLDDLDEGGVAVTLGIVLVTELMGLVIIILCVPIDPESDVMVGISFVDFDASLLLPT
jgi:hypothetical protein